MRMLRVPITASIKHRPVRVTTTGQYKISSNIKSISTHGVDDEDTGRVAQDHGEGVLG